MWATCTTQMVARVTGSTLFANQNLVSMLTFDHRSMSTATDKTSPSADNSAKNTSLINRMRDLRARSPYASFVKDNYRDVSAKYPDLKLADISRKVAEVWRSLSDDKKQNYVKRAQDQKATYENEKQRLSASDLQTIDADEKARRIEHRVKKSIQQLPAKRPRSAYAHFLTTLDRGEADLKDFMRGASQRWSQMTIQDKQKYENLYQEEKQAYIKALVAWDATHAQAPKVKPQRSSSLASSKAKDGTAKKKRGTSATGKRSVSKRASSSSKTAVATKKATKTKSTQTTSDKDTLSSSDDESSSSKKLNHSTSSKKV
ncbi:hypothetical protein I4U23_029270 [Adineta vaga]|nr:hypothetical protein I4U23_029270 [Adineta vaga]